jgi:hypothetical protein
MKMEIVRDNVLLTAWQVELLTGSIVFCRARAQHHCHLLFISFLIANADFQRIVSLKIKSKRSYEKSMLHRRSVDAFFSL